MPTPTRALTFLFAVYCLALCLGTLGCGSETSDQASSGDPVADTPASGADDHDHALDHEHSRAQPPVLPPADPAEAEAKVVAGETALAAGRISEAHFAFQEGVSLSARSGSCRLAERAVLGLGQTAYEEGDEQALADAEVILTSAFFDDPDCYIAAFLLLNRERSTTGGFLLQARDVVSESGYAHTYITRALRLNQGTAKASLAPLSDTTDPEWLDPKVILRGDQVVAGDSAWSGLEDGRAEFTLKTDGNDFRLDVRVHDDEVVNGGEVVMLSVDRAPESAYLFARRFNGAVQPALGQVTYGTDHPEGPLPELEGRYVVGRDDAGYHITIWFPQDLLEHQQGRDDAYAIDVLYRDADADGVSVHRWWGLSPEPGDLFLAGVLNLKESAGTRP